MIAQREAISLEQRRVWSAQIDVHLKHLLGQLAPHLVGACWPWRAEHDMRPLCGWLRSQGVTTALPKVMGIGQPLQWRAWDEATALIADRVGLMYPAEGDPVFPDLLLIPGNAFDDYGFRLGYGAGFFDISLAQAKPRPTAVGVGYAISRVPDLQAQPHDMAMDWLVTERGVEPIR